MSTPTWTRHLATLAACALGLTALITANGLRAGTLVVTTLDDSGPGSLRQAIADAHPGDTITFACNGTITLTSGALVIFQDLTIEGPGPKKLKISGNQADRVFVVAGSAVTIAGVTIRDGLADGNSFIMPCTGGGILNFSSLTLVNDIVCDNQALGQGGQSPFGPGIGSAGGVFNFGTLRVADTSFSRNRARGGDGGDGFYAGHAAAGAIGNVGILSIIGSTFSHNQALGGHDNSGPMGAGSCVGGAIWTGDMGLGPAWLELRDSRLDHNQAIGGDGAPPGTSWGVGGAIQFLNGNGTISGCVFDHNDAIGGAGVPGGVGAWGMGGAINASGMSSVTINESTVDHNLAQGGPGGLGGNGGGAGGGGLRSESEGVLTVINTTVAHNHAQGGTGSAGGTGGDGVGGGCAIWYGSLSLQGATVTQNLALGGGPGGQGIGGGVFWVGNFTCDDSTIITKNHASTSNDNIAP